MALTYTKIYAGRLKDSALKGRQKGRKLTIFMSFFFSITVNVYQFFLYRTHTERFLMVYS